MKDYKNNYNIELLAPVGSKECLRAAINAGADAVYASGKCFGARAYASNFDTKDMIEAIEYVHLYNKKLYMTVNTLLKNEEIDKLYSYIMPFYKVGLDAVIVQDIGVVKYIHDNFKDLPIHASTQMTIMTDMGISKLKEYGVTRVVTPRELSIKEINKIKSESNIEIETFIHGALCYCYSGQCLMSSMLGNRSGNRGRCAQPCRKEYLVDGKKTHILSTKDLCSIDLIGDLIESGIDSFKIEGRMKKAEYVSLVTSTYRKYIDDYVKNGCITINKKEISKDKERLMDIYNRGGFTDGYFYRHNGKEMMSLDRPNHYGVKVGKVTKVYNNKCDIRLLNKVNGKDVLEIRGDRLTNSDNYEFTLKDMEYKDDLISTRVYKNLKISKGQLVYRVRNQKLIDEISSKYIQKDKKNSVSIRFLAKKGTNMKIFLKDIISNIEIECISDMVVDKACNAPVSIERVKKQLLKFGDTKFEPIIQSIEMDNDVFIPMSKINEIRRNAVDMLQKKIISSYYRNLDIKNKDVTISESIDNAPLKKGFNYSVLINKEEMIDVLLDYPQINRVYIDIYDIENERLLNMSELLLSKNIQVYIALPHVLRYDSACSLLNEYEESLKRCSGFLVRNFEGISLANKFNKDFIIDYNMYSFNDYATKVFKDIGIKQYTTCIESSKEEISKMKDKDGEILVYGHITVMLSAGCVNKNINKCTNKTKLLRIKGEKDQFIAKNICKYCYNIIYNDRPILLEKTELNNNNLRIDLIMENKDKIREVLNYYINDKDSNSLSGIKGHYQRGVE